MIISHKNKLIFFHIPKTARSSLTYILRDHISSPNIKKTDFDKGGWQGMYHVDGNQHSRYLDNVPICEKYEHYFKFAFVRNPWDLAFSWYLSLFGRNDDNPAVKAISQSMFKEFLFKYVKDHSSITEPLKWINKQKHKSKLLNKFIVKKHVPVKEINDTQISYIVDRHGQIAVDYLAKFENFKTELDYIFNYLKITNYENVSLNVSNYLRYNYRDYYDQESRELIKKIYKDDIDILGYKF